MSRLRTNLLAIFALLAALSLGGWLGSLFPVTDPWELADLRLLDVSATLDPAEDITAIYTRQAGFNCQVRLDLLDLPEPQRYHIWIHLDARAVELRHDAPTPRDASVDYDPIRETLVVTLRNCAPRPGSALRVKTPSERFETRFDAPAPDSQITLRFVFNNLFSPVATPAQALRRWDGAHTGPRGERHGLRGLLDASEQHHIPLTLLDIKTPAALSALDALGGLDRLRRMERAGLLEMPLVRNAEIGAGSLAGSASASESFGLRPVDAVYDTASPAPVLPLTWPDPALSRDGLPLDMRLALVRGAVANLSPQLLGGDFQKTLWGTFEYSDPAFAYLAARPYIRFENSYPLPQADAIPAAATSPIRAAADELRAVLAAADPQLAASYAGLLPVIEAAATWAENPAPQAVCADLCILASEDVYAVLNPLGGRLVFLFVGQEQVIGPTAQFFIGLSDRSQWKLEQGEAADPAQVMGAFADAGDPFRSHQAEVVDANTIRMVSAEGQEKLFVLTGDGMQVTFSGPLQTKIPLALAPQARFAPGWMQSYHLARDANGIRLWRDGGLGVRIQVSGGAVLAADSFLDAVPLLAFPEDPNAENPPGIYLPFPITMISISAADAAQVNLGLFR